jgi:hypothetical protein
MMLNKTKKKTKKKQRSQKKQVNFTINETYSAGLKKTVAQFANSF